MALAGNFQILTVDALRRAVKESESFFGERWKIISLKKVLVELVGVKDGRHNDEWTVEYKGPKGVKGKGLIEKMRIVMR